MFIVDVEDNVLQQGFNATVQFGPDVCGNLWPGQQIILQQHGTEDTTGLVVCLHTCRLQDVPQKYLAIETNQRARTHEGLIVCFANRHGRKLGNSIPEQRMAVVTVVVFEA